MERLIEVIGSDTRTVTKVAVQAKRRDRVSVFLDGEFAFGMAEEVAMRNGIRPGARIDRTVLTKLLTDEEATHCKRVALRYISYRMRSEQEVRRRLAKEEASPSTIDKVLSDLREIGVVDDAAFAHAYARDAVVGRKWGPYRIAKGLRQAGIGSPQMEEALTEVRHLLEDEDLVVSLAQKRWRLLSDVTDVARRKKRVYDYLLRRGFDFDEVRRALNDLEP